MQIMLRSSVTIFLLPEQDAQPALAQVDAGLPFQMISQPLDRPNGEGIAEFRRFFGDRFF